MLKKFSDLNYVLQFLELRSNKLTIFLYTALGSLFPSILLTTLLASPGLTQSSTICGIGAPPGFVSLGFTSSFGCSGTAFKNATVIARPSSGQTICGIGTAPFGFVNVGFIYSTSCDLSGSFGSTSQNATIIQTPSSGAIICGTNVAPPGFIAVGVTYSTSCDLSGSFGSTSNNATIIQPSSRSGNSSGTNNAPNINNPAAPTAPPITRASKWIIERNCSPERHTIHYWTFDETTTQWKEWGSIAPQWNNDGTCDPETTVDPPIDSIEMSFENKHQYRIVAVAPARCGGKNNPTSSNCVVKELGGILIGDSNGICLNCYARQNSFPKPKPRSLVPILQLLLAN